MFGAVKVKSNFLGSHKGGDKGVGENGNKGKRKDAVKGKQKGK